MKPVKFTFNSMLISSCTPEIHGSLVASSLQSEVEKRQSAVLTASNDEDLQYINADCNAAANIIRKVSATLGLNLDGVSRGALTTPLRIRFWCS